MNGPDQLNPLKFAGCFAYVDSDVPPGVPLKTWRLSRTARMSEPPLTAMGRTEQGRAGADLAPEDRTLRVPGRARRPRSGRGPSPRRNR
jgi:hypothetical protein